MPKPLALFAVGLLWACASYEQAPFEPNDGDEPARAGASSTAGAAGRSGGAGMRAVAPGGGQDSGGQGGGGQGGGGSANGTAGASAGGAPNPPSAGSSGQTSGGAAAGGGAGMVGGMATTRTWTFEQDVEGWAVREQSPELSVMLTPATGAVRLNDVPFSAAKQFVDVAFTFPDDVDLRGRTLRAVVQRVSGEFVGAQLYVYGGAWGSPGFQSLTSGAVTTLTVSLDALTAMGVTPGNIARVGVKFQTGSNTANTFGPTTIELTEVAIE